MASMNILARIIRWLKPAPKSAEDIAAEREGARIRDELKTTRASTRAPAGEYYEAQRRRK
jgi:hypothetical protein